MVSVALGHLIGRQISGDSLSVSLNASSDLFPALSASKGCSLNYTASDISTAIAPLTQTLTNKTLTDFINTGIQRVTSALVKTSNTTLAAITGLSVPLTASGVYMVRVHLPITADSAGGAKVSLDTSDTLTLTSSNITAFFYNTGAYPAISTTTSGLTTALGATQVILSAVIEAVLVVNAAGTLVIKGAQNVSDASATTFLANGYMHVGRIA